VLPWIGAFFSKDDHAYHYLPASVLQFPSPAAFARLMSETGFDDVRFKPMTLGIVTLFVGSRQ
jgi:demethylmenaquinone methyltransferase/2-methoxy-6-polyprenyl-1,4-benzoquinol methylase